MMLGILGIGLYVLALLVGLALVPLGLPGLWLQVGAAALLALGGGGDPLGWRTVAAFAALALIGEAVEFLSGRWGARRFGGSHGAEWGALAGGIVGAFVGGVPVPIVGAIVMSFVGTFAGALLGEMWVRRRVAPDVRVAAGAVIGRVVGVATKCGIGMTICVLGVAALVVG